MPASAAIAAVPPTNAEMGFPAKIPELPASVPGAATLTRFGNDEGFLLPADMTALIARAAASNVLNP